MSVVLHQQIEDAKGQWPRCARKAQHYAPNPVRDRKPLLCVQVLDQHRRTSVVPDLRPTILHVNGQNASDWKTKAWLDWFKFETY